MPSVRSPVSRTTYISHSPVFCKTSAVECWRRTRRWSNNESVQRVPKFILEEHLLAQDPTISYPARGLSLPRLSASSKHIGTEEDRDLKRRLLVPSSLLPENLSATTQIWITTKLERQLPSLKHGKSKLPSIVGDSEASATRASLEAEEGPKSSKRQADEVGLADRPVTKWRKLNSAVDKDLSQDRYCKLFPGLAYPRQHELFRFGSGKGSSLLDFIFSYNGERFWEQPVKKFSFTWKFTAPVSEVVKDKNETTTAEPSEPKKSDNTKEDLPATPLSVKTEPEDHPSSDDSLLPRTSSPQEIKSLEASSTAATFPKGILRRDLKRSQVKGEVEEARERVTMTLDNIHLYTLEQVIETVDDTIDPAEAISPKFADEIKDKALQVKQMLQFQWQIYKYRKSSETLRGTVRTNWDDVDWNSPKCINRVWIELIYAEKKERLTWEGIPPTNIINSARQCLSSEDKLLQQKQQSIIDNLVEQLESTKRPIDLQRLHIIQDTTSAGLTDLWGSQIEEIFDLVNSLNWMIEEYKLDKKVNRGEFKRREVTAYRRFLASVGEDGDHLTAESPYFTIHKRTRRLEAEGDRETKKQKERSKKSGKSVSFSSDVKCRTFDQKSREILDVSDEELRGNSGNAPKKRWKEDESEEEESMYDTEEKARVEKACASLAQSLIRNEIRFATPRKIKIKSIGSRVKDERSHKE